MKIICSTCMISQMQLLQLADFLYQYWRHTLLRKYMTCQICFGCMSWSAPGYSCYSYGRHWSHSYTHSIHYKTENSCLQLKTKTKLIGKKERYSPNYAEFNTLMLRGRKTFCYQQTPQLSRIECETQAFAFTLMLSLNCVCNSQFQKSANIE